MILPVLVFEKQIIEESITCVRAIREIQVFLVQPVLAVCFDQGVVLDGVLVSVLAKTDLAEVDCWVGEVGLEPHLEVDEAAASVFECAVKAGFGLVDTGAVGFSFVCDCVDETTVIVLA